jgi:WD40 repeat protein
MFSHGCLSGESSRSKICTSSAIIAQRFLRIMHGELKPSHERRIWRGHKGSINCIDATPEHEGLVSTGSDDMSIRIWDIRTERSAKCILGCLKSPVEAVRFHPIDSHRLFAACGREIFEFDLRADGILIKIPRNVSETAATDDIDCIMFRDDGEELAVSDDNGVVTIVEPNHLETRKPRRLKDVHSSLVNAIAYNPVNSHQIVSGGFDYQVCSWDLSGRGLAPAPSAVVNIDQLGCGAEASSAAHSSQMVNPPFVQCISYAYGGRAVVTVLGDGSLKVLDAADLYTLLASDPDAHSGMATALHVTSSSSSHTSGTVTTAGECVRGDLIFTGGEYMYYVHHTLYLFACLDVFICLYFYTFKSTRSS